MIGVYHVSVDPAMERMEVSPVSSYSTNPIPGDGAGASPNFTITSSNIVWNGLDTTDFDLTVKWLDPSLHMGNVSLQWLTTTDFGAELVNSDSNNGFVIQTFPPITDPPLISYVSDTLADGPETYTLCDSASTCVSTHNTYISAECGEQTALWTIRSSGTPFEFWLGLFADLSPVDLLSDTRYDPSTASIFFARFQRRPGRFQLSRREHRNHLDGGGRMVLRALLRRRAGERQFLSLHNRPVNRAAYNSGLSSTANYWYVGGLSPWSIRFDPYAVEINANDGSGGSSGLKFTTAGGTKMYTVDDTDLGAVDGFNVRFDPYNSSNSMAIFMGQTSRHASATYFYPVPGNGLDGFANFDWDVGRVSLRAIGQPGGNSPIKIAYTSHTLLVAYRTEGTPYNSADDFSAVIPRSLNWPDWCEKTPNGACLQGQHNAERAWICIQ